MSGFARLWGVEGQVNFSLGPEPGMFFQTLFASGMEELSTFSDGGKHAYPARHPRRGCPHEGQQKPHGGAVAERHLEHLGQPPSNLGQKIQQSQEGSCRVQTGALTAITTKTNKRTETSANA